MTDVNPFTPALKDLIAGTLPSVSLLGPIGNQDSDRSYLDFSLYGFKGLHEVINLHPAFVHFPIALFPTMLLFYGLGVILKKPSLLIGGRILLYLAVLATIITVITGQVAMDSVPHNEAFHHMMLTHATTGYLILGLAVVLIGWSFWHRDQVPCSKWGFLLAAALTTYLVLQNGDIGSRMVYIHGAAVKPAIPDIKEGPEHEHGNNED